MPLPTRVDDVGHGDPKAADGGPPGQDIRILRDAIERRLIQGHRLLEHWVYPLIPFATAQTVAAHSGTRHATDALEWRSI